MVKVLACFSTMVNCDALVRSGVPLLPGLTTVPQKDEPDMMDAGRVLARNAGVPRVSPFPSFDLLSLLTRDLKP